MSGRILRSSVRVSRPFRFGMLRSTRTNFISSRHLLAGLIPAGEHHLPVLIDLGLGELDQVPDIAWFPAPVPVIVAVDLPDMPADEASAQALCITLPLPHPEGMLEKLVAVHGLAPRTLELADLRAEIIREAVG